MKVGLRSKTLLVVDDNAGILESLTEIATAVGFAVTAVSSHKAALRAIDRQAFDAALVDKRLVEVDAENRDGLAILGHLKERGEGTYLILLTGLGQYRDAVEASEKYGARLLEKTIDLSFEAKLRQVLTETINLAPPRPSLTAVETWCGDEDPLTWEMAANSVLHPKPNIGTMLNLLEQLAITCQPVMELPGSGGLRKVADGALAGVFWSRGVGEAVLVTVQKEATPPTQSAADDVPASLAVGLELHRVIRKGLIGIVSRCTGVEPQLFTERRKIQ